MEPQLMDKLKVLHENIPLLLSLGMHCVSAILIIAAGFILGNWVHNRIASFRRLDQTLSGFLAGFAKYAIIAIALVTVLGQFGVQTASLLAVLGAAGLAIGLAMQGTLSNVAAGVMLLILRPFRIGDYIIADSIGGTVKSLGLFGAELATPDNVYIFIPNNKIWSGEIWNYSRNARRRQDINVGISYDDDIGKAFEIIHGVMNNDERIIKDQDDIKPQVVVNNMGESSINIIVRFWCRGSDYWDIRFGLTKAIKEALDEGGINIPFPTRTLHVIGDDSAKVEKAIRHG